jgi:hypothetical protein
MFQHCLGSLCLKNTEHAGLRWLKPVIVATQEEKIRRIVVRSQPGKQFKRPYLEKIQHKKGLASGSRDRSGGSQFEASPSK